MDDPAFRQSLLELGQKIRQLRVAKGLSQEVFASTCGLDRTYIGGVERGERNLSLKNLLRISDALGVTASELLAGIPSDRDTDSASLPES